MYNLISVKCTGIGSEFCQGILSPDLFNLWLKVKVEYPDTDWNTFCQEQLEVDGYWEINEIAHFTALVIDHCVIKIHVNETLFFEGSYSELRDIYDDEDVLDSNYSNESAEYGRLLLPQDIEYQSWIERRFDNIHNGNKDNSDVLVTVKTSEIFNVKNEITTSEPFDILKFGLIGVSSDEMGFGIDHSDYLLGFKVNDEKCHFEYPGGIGPLETPHFL
tara:strand:+ start:3161 stop:3814 length:654 start_codon:yes stop_codon:yes gene_type:complete